MIESDQAQLHDHWSADNEIDLRQYFGILIRWWREIVGINVIVVVLAILTILGIRVALPLHYVASSDVAIVRTVSDVNFDERFRTAEEELGTDTGSRSARRSALLGLATTGAIAQKVIDDIGTSLEPFEQLPANLVEMVEAEAVIQAGSRTDSDLIRIVVTADDPEKAARIANSWAQNYVDQVNALYSQVPDDVLTSIQTELSTAEAAYLTAQANLETFISNNRIDELNTVVSILQQRISQEVTLHQALLLQWQNAQEQLQVANTLFAQVEAGGAGAVRTAMPALQVLKISAYGMPSEQLQIELRDFSEITAEAMLADIAGIQQSLGNQIQALEAQIAAKNDELQPANAEAQPLTAVLEELSKAKAQLEQEQARQRQLNQQRDLTWDTFRTLSSKVAELNLTRAAASSEVRFGAAAVPPVDPTRRISLTVGILVAGFAGLFLALVVVAGLELAGVKPLFGRSAMQS
ncbi:MAG: hypothetical protein KDE53_16010 [Caldilineaceae bacterium]|nr:hypothetical protein [Caldilineaceae bacterium]